MLPKARQLVSVSKIAEIISGSQLTLDRVAASCIKNLTWCIQQPLHKCNLKSIQFCMCRRVENETMCIWSKTGMLAFPLALRDNCTNFRIKFEHYLIHQQNLAQAVPQRKHSRHLHRKWKPTARGALHKKCISFTDWREVRLWSSLKPWFSLSLQADTHIPLQSPRNHWAKVHSDSHSSLQAPQVNQYRQLLWLLPKCLQRYGIYTK